MSIDIYVNGNVISLDKDNIYEAFAVRDGKFIAVGSNEYLLSLFSTYDYKITDLKGNTVVPGFNDAHMHLLNYGFQKTAVQLNNLSSIDEMICVVKSYIDKNNIPKDTYIISRGWNDNFFKEHRLPNRYDLDKISCDHPIIFSRICGHIGVLNSKAIELLGIDKMQENPTGGAIDRENEIPTGILRENALNIALSEVPPTPVDEIKSSLRSTFHDLIKCGITSVQTEDLTHCRSLPNLIQSYKELEEEGNLPVRITLQLCLNTNELLDEAKNLGLKSKVGSDFLKIGGLKLFQDGSLGARTAAMIDNYEDTPDNGINIYSQENLDSWVFKCFKQGFQIIIHGIGDRACEMILNSYEKISKDTEDNLRPVIVHCQFTNDDLLNRFKEISVIANVQPAFIMSDYRIVEKAVGKDRTKDSYAFNSMVQKGIPVAFSSDAPIESFNIIDGIHGAVNRTDLNDKPEGGFNINEGVTVVDALKAYTTGPSYMSFDEDVKGKIRVNYLADFVVLSQDITSVPRNKIKETKVLEAYVNGLKVL
ncbi:amidohydrolase [Clostridium sp.]|uniref:amidohydrolase n=1 Tax=Clostridium sp. TaxID=1506 RepID=UPI0032174D10